MLWMASLKLRLPLVRTHLLLWRLVLLSRMGLLPSELLWILTVLPASLLPLDIRLSLVGV